MKIATKLTKKVAEFVKEVSGLDYEYAADKDLFFHYPNFINQSGFENNYHLSGGLKLNHKLVSEQEFIDMVTADLFKEAQKPKEMKTKCIVLGQENDPVKELKKIELLGCIMRKFPDINTTSFSDGALDPSKYSSLILYPRANGYSIDVIKAISDDGDEILMVGHWNDGVV